MPQTWTPAQDSLLRAAVAKYEGKRWKMIAAEVPGRNEGQCLQRWSKTLKPGIVRGKWSPAEDAHLRSLVQQWGKEWSRIAEATPGRTSKQCRQRWRFQLDPSLNHGPFTAAEDRVLVRMHAELGTRWSKIAQQIEGRTPDAVKVRWKSITRKRKRDAKMAAKRQAGAGSLLVAHPAEPSISPPCSKRQAVLTLEHGKPEGHSSDEHRHSCVQPDCLTVSVVAQGGVPAPAPSPMTSLLQLLSPASRRPPPASPLVSPAAAAAGQAANTSSPSLEFGIKSINSLLDTLNTPENDDQANSGCGGGEHICADVDVFMAIPMVKRETEAQKVSSTHSIPPANQHRGAHNATKPCTDIMSLLDDLEGAGHMPL